jgi:hypothetical protein
MPIHGIPAENIGQSLERDTPQPKVKGFFDVDGFGYHVWHHE